MKKFMHVATVVEYFVEQGKRYTCTTYFTACSLKGLTEKLRLGMINSDNYSGIESYIIHDRLYSIQEAKELRLLS